MATLYEMTGQYQFLLSLAEDPDTDPNILEDSMEALVGEIEDKCDGYAKVMTELKARKFALKGEKDRIDERIKTIDRNLDRMSENLKDTMLMMERPKIKTALFTFSVQNNPAHVVMDETYIENIPERYLVKQEPKLDKKLILEDLNAGADLDGIAHLEQDTSLRIR